MVLASRTKNGKLYISDASSSKGDFLSLGGIYEEWNSIEILRIDDKIFNIEYLEGLIKK